MKGFSHYEYAEYWQPEKFAKFYDVLLGNTEDKEDKIIELLDWLADIAKDDIEFFLQRNQQPLFSKDRAFWALDMLQPELAFSGNSKDNYSIEVGLSHMARRNGFELALNNDDDSTVLELIEQAIPYFRKYHKTLWYYFDYDEERYDVILTDSENNEKFIQACYEFGFFDIDSFKKT